ncbi:DUF305 domain-containing protein [Streptomyces fagopyri]|uniref:DUF305 domain-containing protein n=1 Tax=Streptomyces fagopyri TaxID=2662397 RepID=UPI0036BF08E8
MSQEVAVLFRRSPRASLVTAALVAVVLTLGACDDSGAPADSGRTGGPSVIAPGKPGEAAETLSADDAAKRRTEDDSPNSADFAYARMMIEHHTQALEMTRLAPGQAGSGRVKALAARIAASQGPEISTMKGWLDAHHGDGHATRHQHGAMPGMATEAQLKALRVARGKVFDRLFLKLMITHHDGAVSMATDVKARGNNIQIEEMADDVMAQQTSEISRMRAMS